MKLELQNVHFSYRTRYQTTEVLKGVDCVFSEGQVYGIIGKSGSGKSTVLSLMAGLMLPQTGSVLLDGADTRKLNLETYRREYEKAGLKTEVYSDIDAFVSVYKEAGRSEHSLCK